jgi:hypothetical protein
VKEQEKTPPNFWNMLSNLALVRFLLLFASGWAGVQLLAYFETAVAVFTIAALVAFLLNYPGPNSPEIFTAKFSCRLRCLAHHFSFWGPHRYRRRHSFISRAAIN